MNREEAVEILKKVKNEVLRNDVEQAIDFAMSSIEQGPSRKGHWIKTNSGYECSECAIESRSKSDFCQYCGADMRGGVKI